MLLSKDYRSSRQQVMSFKSDKSESDIEPVKVEEDSNNMKQGKPNIVFILADDLGWNSMGYEINFDLTFATPFLTSLALKGIIMNQYYAQEVG